MLAARGNRGAAVDPRGPTCNHGGQRPCAIDRARGGWRPTCGGDLQCTPLMQRSCSPSSSARQRRARGQPARPRSPIQGSRKRQPMAARPGGPSPGGPRTAATPGEASANSGPTSPSMPRLPTAAGTASASASPGHRTTGCSPPPSSPPTPRSGSTAPACGSGPGASRARRPGSWRCRWARMGTGSAPATRSSRPTGTTTGRATSASSSRPKPPSRSA